MVCDGCVNLMLQFRLKKGGRELILDPWEESVTRYDSMTISTRGEVASGMRKGGDDTSWADANFTGPKNK
jgi:hypothetical protein